ncbi:MAG: hypothetical protein ABL957_14995 [Parvularculaceae bacterium]
MRATLLQLAVSFVVFLVSGLALSAPASAQDCAAPVCRSGESYRVGAGGPSPYGVCESPCRPPAPCSHYIAACPTGWTLDVPAGVCNRDLCSGCGVELPLCSADESYSRSETGPDGRVYGVCNHGTCGPGACSHQIKYCREGWTLQTATGLCQRDCAAAARPDLILRSAWLKTSKGVRTKTVRRGLPYYACFEVANIGTAASGPFYVGGGGLGVPRPPEQAHANLAPGASREGCLSYPTTPSAGTWRIGLTADSRGTVVEILDTNNGRTLTVIVRR